MPESFCCQS